jgi:hypothetical protein
VATANGNSVIQLAVSVDGVQKKIVKSNFMDTELTLELGQRRITVTAKDADGYYWKTHYATVQ